MSRPAKRIGAFNKELFSELLKKAKGDLKQADFAALIPISHTYFSTFISCNSDRPLMPAMLEKIANASNGRVSYEELLESCGYDPKVYAIQEKKQPFRYSETEYNKISGIITSRLIKSPFPWSIARIGESNCFFDLELKLDYEGINGWLFDMIVSTSGPKSDRRHALYGYLAEYPDLSTKKFSVITNNPAVYNDFKQHKPINLNAYISVVLIDLDDFTIKFEETLQRPSNLPMDCPIHFDV